MRTGLSTSMHVNARGKKGKFMLSSDHIGSLLRQQPRAMTIGYTPEGKAILNLSIDSAQQRRDCALYQLC